jgi:copper chaperone CopZ
VIKTEVVIEGMACGMCESHINDVIRKNFNVKKVSSSHKKKRTEIISESEISEEELHKAIDPTGYKVISVNNKPYEKKKYSFFGKK